MPAHVARITGLTTAAATVLFALAACTRTPAPAPAAAPGVDAARGNGFTVTLALSEAASRIVAVEHATITVSAEWFGYPTVAAQQRQLPGTEQAWLSLHRETRETGGAGEVHFRSPVFDPADLALIERGRPQLRIEVHDGDGSVHDALLDCGAFQGELASAERDGVGIDCRLAAE
ncbi:hypothetical protein E5843_01380 [Luteimonas yindakuii]|uniref:hypothetical protein n=1 Tax=Luteimonas yindakuii TaxID=2565782 RepID=UPI0010A3EBD0|nr:hypothetical protein [Luteimonas yindakuii]QCO66779.1 hypothetical protein E5843_01380 [Luteimonas yindakuii]